MKKLFCVSILFAVTLAMLFAQNAELPRLGVMEFSTNLNTTKVKADAITVRDLVERQMQGTSKYRMISRNEIDKLVKNQSLQASSISSAENIQKLKLENIRYIVTGSVNAMDNDYYSVTVKILDVSSGVFSHIEDAFMGGGSRDLYNGINSLMVKFIAGMSTSRDGTIIQGTGTYKIGDTGPAGGIIFYDRGFVSDGWRYLEAAPAGTDFTAQWGAYEKDVSGTGTTIGSGKRNTQLIVERLKQLGENDRAAQICVGMVINGYKDWFLPSRDELDLMYRNLKQKGLGGFSIFEYWSSSQYSNYRAWFQSFSDGSHYDATKIGTTSVRAVRAF